MIEEWDDVKQNIVEDTTELQGEFSDEKEAERMFDAISDCGAAIRKIQGTSKEVG